MLPQLDTTYYLSQFFWLVVCFCVLIFAFKKVFIPRINALITRRDSFVKKEQESAEELEQKIRAIEEEIEGIRIQKIKRSAEIIKAATKKSKKVLEDQLSTLKKENEELTANLRKKFKNDIINLESSSKIQIEETAQVVFDKLFRREEKL